MTDLIDMNHDEKRKAKIQFSREPISTESVENSSEFSTEHYARRELEYLKLRALAHSFGLDAEPQMWFYLALKLAQLHYPEPKKAGRKLKWDNQSRKILLSEVEHMVNPSDQTHGVNHVCKILAQKEPWLSLLGGKPNQSEALRIQYYKAKNADKK